MTTLTPPPIDSHTLSLINMAVGEDLGREGHAAFLEGRRFPPGDRTVELAIAENLQGAAKIVTRRPGVICGTYLIESILREYGPGLRSEIAIADGTRVAPGDVVATIAGPVRGMLSAERVLLNFIGHMSGVATTTRRYVDAVAGIEPRPAICDIRKTTPAFRVLDKYAVRCGGGVNHRMGLYDGVMLKDNHLAALRERLGQGLTLAQLTAAIRKDLDPALTLWLEVDQPEQLFEALPQKNRHGAGAGRGADIILLDNFTPALMRAAVEWRDSIEPRGGAERRTLLEASGGITLETIGEVARTGVDRISIGALTHSAPALDVSMEFVSAQG